MTFRAAEFLDALDRRHEELRETMHDDDLAEIHGRVLAGETVDAVEHYAVLEEVERRAALTAHEWVAERRERDGRKELT